MPEKRMLGMPSILGSSGDEVAGKASAQTLLERSQSGPRGIRSFGEFPCTGRLWISRHLRGSVCAVIEIPQTEVFIPLTPPDRLGLPLRFRRLDGCHFRPLDTLRNAEIAVPKTCGDR